MPPPYVTRLAITKPPVLGGGQWQLSNLTSLTAIFGKNGSGKSLLLRAWRDTNPEECHYVVPERSGEIDYQPHYLTQQLDAQHRQEQSQRNFVDQYRRQIVARIQAYFTARGDTRADQLPGRPEDLEAFLSQLLPDFTIALSGTRTPPYQLTRVSNGSPVSSIDQLSSGETQLIIIALDILTIAAIWDIRDASSRVMLIDEPDAHIHPDLQVRFADFLMRVSNRYKLQIVIATHSTTLLAACGQFGGEAASVLYLDRAQDHFAAQPFTSMLKELAACLGGHALMGPLFGVPLLLVEGNDDYRIWSQVPRHHVVSFAVIPCNGDEIKQYQRTLERLFQTLKEDLTTPAGYTLIDGDKGRPQADHATPQNHVKYIQLVCHESENLYLTDEVLTLVGVTWVEAVPRIVAEADKYGQKAAKLRSAAEWDRQQSDIKDVIQEVSKILALLNFEWVRLPPG